MCNPPDIVNFFLTFDGNIQRENGLFSLEMMTTAVISGKCFWPEPKDPEGL